MSDLTTHEGVSQDSWEALSLPVKEILYAVYRSETQAILTCRAIKSMQALHLRFLVAC